MKASKKTRPSEFWHPTMTTFAAPTRRPFRTVGTITPAPSRILQRKCACGGTQLFGGECAECKTNAALKRKDGNQNSSAGRLSLSDKSILQPKLTVGASSDTPELEADRVADQVLAAPAYFAIRGRPPSIQRFTELPTAPAVTAPASVENVLAQPGIPMEPALRRDMEHRFGHDFSHVRVHSSLAAKQSAREVNAKAYTVGHDVVFGEGHYSPGTHEGRRLIAHELTHVVQQSVSPAPASPETEGTANGRPQASVNHHTDVHLARAPLTSGAASVPAAQNRAEAVQRIFTPGLSLDAVMRLIESIRPSESASGLYTLVWAGQALTITQAEYDKIRASARQSLLVGLRKVRGKTQDAQAQYDAQLKIDEDQYIVSGIVRFVGGIKDPGVSILVNTTLATVNANAAQTFIERGELVRAAEFLAKGERFAISAKTSSQAYVDNVISTAEITATVLEVTAVTAAATVVVIGAILAAPAIVAAAQAAPLALALSTGAAPAVPVVAVEAVAVTAPAAVAVSAPAVVAVSAPAAVAVAAPAAVAIPATAAVAVPATAAASSLSTAALATAGVAVAGTTLSSDSPKPADREKEKKGGANAMRFQVQWGTNEGGPTFALPAVAPSDPGITTIQAVTTLNAVLATVTPKRAKEAAIPAAEKQIKWILKRPPGGIGPERISRSEYFPYQSYTDSRVDVENLRGRNLRI